MKAILFVCIVISAFIGVSYASNNDPKKAPGNLMPNCKQTHHMSVGDAITTITCGKTVYTIRDKGCSCGGHLYKDGEFVKASGWEQGPCPHKEILRQLNE